MLPGGALLAPLGVLHPVRGFPLALGAHAGKAYVGQVPYSFFSGPGGDALQVVDVKSGTTVQSLDHPGGHTSFVRVGNRLFAAGGSSGTVVRYDVDPDGFLTPAPYLTTPTCPTHARGHVMGLAWAPVQHRVLATLFVLNDGLTSGLAWLDPDDPSGCLESLKTFPNPGAFDVAVVSDTTTTFQYAVSNFRGEPITFVDQSCAMNAGVQCARLDPGGASEFLLVTKETPPGLLVSLPGKDAVVRLEPDGAGWSEFARKAFAGEDPPRGTSPSALAQLSDGRVAIALARTNQVHLCSARLSDCKAIGTGQYPTALLDTDEELLVLSGRGPGSRPRGNAWEEDEAAIGNAGHDNTYTDGDRRGGLQRISHADLTPAAIEQRPLPPDGTQPAIPGLEPRHPDGTDADCSYPVPRRRGGTTEIEHIVLVVRENKTYDALLGHCEAGGGGAVETLRCHSERPGFGSGRACSFDAHRDQQHRVTPSLTALAQRYAVFDNFYAEAEVSTLGHAWLTGSFASEYIERMHTQEGQRTDENGNYFWSAESAFPAGSPPWGTFFQHLIRNNKSFVILGEGAGLTGGYGGDYVVNHVDLSYPGVIQSVKETDAARVQHFLDHYGTSRDTLPAFTFLLLPRDHTRGTTPGEETPEWMVAENDFALGRLVAELSRNEDVWSHTAVFVVQDDTQDGCDHVDSHRTLCLVASPYAVRGVSHVHHSFPSLFRTFELILDIDPMNRLDGSAVAMWEAFRPARDNAAPFDAPHEPEVKPGKNPTDGATTAMSAAFWGDGLDESPGLGELVHHAITGSTYPGSKLLEHAARTDFSAVREARERDRSEEEDDREARIEALRRWQHERGGLRPKGRQPKM